MQGLRFQKLILLRGHWDTSCWLTDTGRFAAMANTAFMEARDLGSTSISASESLCDLGKTASPFWVSDSSVQWECWILKAWHALWLLSCSMARNNLGKQQKERNL